MENNNGVRLSHGQVDEIRRVVKSIEKQDASNNAEIKALLKGLVDVIESDTRHIVRSMTFPLVYVQAGIALLHYFGRIVAMLHPDIPVKLYVTQDEHYVKLGVEVPEDSHDVIEETLEHYGLALKGVMPLNEMLPDASQLMEWKQKLDLSALEIKLTRDLLESGDEIRDHDKEALGLDAKQLHQLVGEGVSGLYALTSAIQSVLEENRQQINDALLVLQKKLAGKVAQSDEAEIKAALEAIQRHEPEVFSNIYTIIAGKSITGRVADTLFSWISSLAGLMPR